MIDYYITDLEWLISLTAPVQIKMTHQSCSLLSRQWVIINFNQWHGVDKIHDLMSYRMVVVSPPPASLLILCSLV